MCYKLRADSLILNFFGSNLKMKQVTLRELQEIALRVVKACNHSIIADISHSEVAGFLRRCHGMIEADGYTFRRVEKWDPRGANGKLECYAQLSKVGMPKNVRNALQNIITEEVINEIREKLEEEYELHIARKTDNQQTNLEEEK